MHDKINMLDWNYQNLLYDIVMNGIVKKDRTGTGTVSVFGRTIRHKMSDGFPLLTTKKMHFKGIVTELSWFLKGDTNIKYLVDNGCNIWVGDAVKKYVKLCSVNNDSMNEWMRNNGDGTLSMYTEKEFVEKIKTDEKFANKWGDLGPIYGKQWRSWGYFAKATGGYNSKDYHGQIDQIQNLINDLKNNPDSRRLLVNAWNVAEIPNMTLPPCHIGFQCYTRELSESERFNVYHERMVGKFDTANFKTQEMLDEYGIPKRALSLKWEQRSCDTFLGLPFNIASYGLLLLLLAKEVNMVPEELIGNLGDTHLYSNHLDVSYIQRDRAPFKLPTVEIKKDFNILDLKLDDIVLHNYISHPKIEAQLSN